MAQTVLITGTSSGIGKALVECFAGNGWNVVATMRNPPAGEAGAGNVLVTRLDVQDRDTIAQAIRAGIERFGRIDALINNAGYGQYGVFEGIPREKVQEQFDVNVFGVMDVTRAILPHFRANGGGLIVNVSSGAGFFTLPMISMYCASKFALEGFSEALSYELAAQNIVVKIAEPHGGVTGTSFHESVARAGAGNATPAEYEEFTKRTNEAFAKMAAARTNSTESVARAIYAAATDGTRQLRYPIGDDTRGFVHARREMTEEEYMRFMRSFFPAGEEDGCR